MSATRTVAVTHPPVAFATTEITEDAVQAAARVLRSGWVTAGRETEAFEDELAQWLGAQQVVAVSSCTAAIEMSLRALGLPAGAAVLTPTLTFCGAVQAILHAGLRPVLVDVDSTTLVPRPDQVAAAALRAGRPAAMVVQHMAGFPVDVPAVADAAGLGLDRVVEDAAHGLGTALGDIPVGRDSLAACFSFYATKNLPIGEGGAIATADAEYGDRLRRMRLHGMSRDAWRRYLPGGSWRYSVDEAGMKANFTDVQAAVGRAQLRRLQGWQHRRAELAGRYDAVLAAAAPTIAVPARPTHGRHAWHLYVIRVRPEHPLGRDELCAALGARGVGTSVHFIPVHHLPYFRRELTGREIGELPEADAVFPQLLSLPLHPALRDEDVDAVGHDLLHLSTFPHHATPHGGA